MADQPRAVVHVGAPKTGTTYLQAVLWRNREALRDAGVLYPLQRPDEHFAAALDVREMPWGGRRDGPWLGTWDLVAGRIQEWDGSVVLSNELLGGVTPDQARRVADSMAGRSGREVHVVFTARDLARQLPSDWQEHVKHRHDVTLSTFVDDLVRLGLDAPEPFGTLFWGLHDAARVLGTWAKVVPVENIHLVTVSHHRSGAPDLWQRFAAAVGLDRLQLDLDVEPRNVSLGVAEAELLRRINHELAGRFPHRFYDDLVRQVLAEAVLVAPERGTPPSERPTLPPAQRPWVKERSSELVEAVRSAGYNVVGDLDDLIPSAENDGRQPEDLTSDDLLPVALDALTGLLGHIAQVAEHGAEARELRRRVKQLTAELARARVERDYWRDGGVAHRLVRFTDQHPWALPARRAYIGTRDRLRRGQSRQGGADG